MYNYIGFINKSSAINHSITCNFLNNQSNLNLIITKSNIIEIYNITKEGLESTPYLNVYGRIILIEKIPSFNAETNNSATDNLFILTENLDFCMISYNKAKNEIVNLDKGTIKEDIGKRHEKVYSAFSSNRNYAVISAYKNIFRIIFLKNRNKYEDFSVRYEYEDLLFLFPFNDPDTQNVHVFSCNNSNDKKNSSNIEDQNFGMVIINKSYTSNSIDNRSITLETFQIDIQNHEIIREKDSGSLLDVTNDPTCSLIIPPKIGGLLIFYSNYLKYYRFNNKNRKLVEKEFKSYSDRKFNCYSEVDKLRYLIGDEFGNLFLLAFKSVSHHQNNFSTSSDDFSIIFQLLGEVNYPSTISYLDNNYVFIGSEQANSQLIRIAKTVSNNKPFIEVVEEFDNLAPISDFCIMNTGNNTNENSDEILCASGIYKSSCLKTLRKGTSIISEGEIPIARVRNVFSVNYYADSDEMLIDDSSFIGSVNNTTNFTTSGSLIFLTTHNQTKILNFYQSKNTIEEVESTMIEGYNFIKDDITLFATNIYTNENTSYILLVTTRMIIIYNSSLKMILNVPTVITPVFIKYKKKNRMLYIFNKNNLLIRYDIQSLIKQNISPNNPEVLNDSFIISAFDIGNDILVFSQWDSNKVFIFNLRNKKVEVLCEFDPKVLCSSISFLKSEGYKFLFIALSNGKMLFYKMKSTNIFYKFKIALLVKNFIGYTYTSDDFILKRKYNVSNDIFELNKIKRNKKNFIFINTDLPALLYINKEFPVFSNFNIKECLSIEQIISSTSDLPLYFFIFKDKVEIGSLSNSQSQNISAKYLNKQIYNLKNITCNTNQSNLSNYQNIIAMILEDRNEDKKTSSFSFTLLDNQLSEISRYTLDQDKEVCTNFVEISLPIEIMRNNRKLFALGTGIIENDFSEPQRGFIYLIEMNENFKLKKVGEIETNGGVYKMDSKLNLIFVGISSTLYIYSVNPLQQNYKNVLDYDIKLIKKHSDFTIINDILCHDNYVLVSDIYKSITVFKYDELKETLTECCRDYNPIWCYSMAQVTNNIYLVSDIDGNIFSLRRETYPKSDEEKYKLERINQFNFGERINKLINIKKKIGVKDWEAIHSLTERHETKIFNKLKGEMSLNEKSNQSNQKNNGSNELSMTYFGTLDGTLGIIISIPKETYEYLIALQKEIIKVISSTGNLDYEKYRAFKDGFICDYSKGFVEGSILQEFLNFDQQYRIEFLKNMRYPWQINLNDTINLIESLLKLH